MRGTAPKQVASLDEAAPLRLLAGLSNDDALVCANMQAALGMLARRWGASDPRSLNLVERLRQDFAQFSPAGQEKTLLFLTCFLQLDGPKPWPANVTRGIGELLLEAEKKSELRTVSLLLAAELVDCVERGQWVEPCRAMVERGLSHDRQGTRVAAVQLLLREPMRKDKDLLAKVVPLLRDKEAAVRRVAVLALASEAEVIREDGLIPLLHDDDCEVQDRCEKALALLA